MSDYRVTQQGKRILSPELYLDRYGDVYQMPETRAELLRALHLQRRIVSHLVDVITYMSRGLEVQP
jgi:hypothetical protein